MNKIWVIEAQSRQAGETLRWFDLTNSQPVTNEQQARQLASSHAQALNQQRRLNASDWEPHAYEQEVGVTTLDGYLFNDPNR